jgi:ribose/xylose/arabinose/galactoside ABC-type transport system permease subunit
VKSNENWRLAASANSGKAVMAAGENNVAAKAAGGRVENNRNGVVTVAQWLSKCVS